MLSELGGLTYPGCLDGESICPKMSFARLGRRGFLVALKCRFDKSRQVVRAWREGFALSCVTFRWRDAARPVLLAELPDIVRHLKIGSLHERADFRRGGELVEI